MRCKSFAAYAILATAGLLTACDDGTNTLGSTLVVDSIDVEMYEAPAPEGISVANPTIQSRSVVQLLGLLEAEGYGKLQSDIVTQFTPASVIDLTKFQAGSLDSVMLCMEMYSKDMIGDSIVPMGVEVHRLTKLLPSPIYSDFNPEGYYDPEIYASAIYAPSAIGLNSDSLMNQSIRTVKVALPTAFGDAVLTKYAEDKSMFYNPTAFSEWFKGFYIKNSWGSGRVIRVSRTSIRIYQGSNSFMLMAVTPEVVNNSDMSLTVSKELTSLADAGETVIVAPVGYDVEMTFPADNLLDYYRSHSGNLAVVNSLTLSIPATAIPNDFGIEPPTNLLMVRASEKDNFFLRNEIPDGVWSFNAVYNTTKRTYDFSGMKAYFDTLLAKEEIAADDYTFILTPVNLSTEANSYTGANYVTGVSPYVGEPKMTRLDLKNAEITLTFSKQSINN